MVFNKRYQNALVSEHESIYLYTHFNKINIKTASFISVDSSKPVLERDVFILRLCDATWCAVFRHGHSATAAAPGPTEVKLFFMIIVLYIKYIAICVDPVSLFFRYAIHRLNMYRE